MEWNKDIDQIPYIKEVLIRVTYPEHPEYVFYLVEKTESRGKDCFRITDSDDLEQIGEVAIIDAWLELDTAIEGS